MRSFEEAVTLLEDVQLFLDRKGCSQVATRISSNIDSVVNLQWETKLLSARQSTLDNFFT